MKTRLKEMYIYMKRTGKKVYEQNDIKMIIKRESVKIKYSGHTYEFSNRRRWSWKLLYQLLEEGK